MAWFQLAFWYCACFPHTFTEHSALARAHSISMVVNQKDGEDSPRSIEDVSLWKGQG